MIDLRHLRHLVVLAERLNYVRAADELGITQPALTRSIQALERQVGTRLFDRDRGGVALTPQGRAIAERARFLLTDAEDLTRFSEQYGQGESGRVRFGMAPMPARALLRRVLSERLAVAPTVTNEVVVRDVEALWGMLIGGEIEFFVSPNPPAHDLSQAQVETLDSFPLGLILRSEHPLLADPSMKQRFPLLRSSWGGMALPREFERYVQGSPNIVEDFGILAGLTASSDAIWFSSPCAVQEEIADGSLVEFRRADLHVELGIYSLKRRSRSPLAQSLVSALERHAGTLPFRMAHS